MKKRFFIYIHVLILCLCLMKAHVVYASYSMGSKIFPIIDYPNISVSKFGCSVSISGNYAIFGMPNLTNSPNYTEAGLAFIYKIHDNGTIELQSTLTRGIPGDLFGNSVSIYGNFAIVGAPRTDDFNGAVYFYQLSADKWILNKEIKGTSWFGYDVELYDEYAIVGASNGAVGASSGAASSLGSIIIYKFVENEWTKLISIANPSDRFRIFGSSVSISENYFIVSSNKLSDPSYSRTYFYSFFTNGYTNKSQVVDNTGLNVCISNNYAVIGDFYTNEVTTYNKKNGHPSYLLKSS